MGEAGGFDLAKGDLSEKSEQSADFGLQTFEQNYRFRDSVFQSAISLCITLYLVAIVLAVVLVCHMINLPKDKTFYWQSYLLVLTFVLPPTLILVGLMRGVFPKSEKDSDKDGGFLGPASAAIKAFPNTPAN